MTEVETLVNVTRKYAAKKGLKPDLQDAAVALAWYAWQRSDRDLPASSWARFAVLQALAGRDLPGVRSPRKDDALDYAVQGAGMQEVRERGPGPEERAIAREAWERLQAGLTVRQKEVLSLIDQGLTTGEIAHRLGVTAGAVSQQRRAIAERWQG